MINWSQDNCTSFRIPKYLKLTQIQIFCNFFKIVKNTALPKHPCTYNCNITEKLPGVSKPSSRQYGGAGSQSSSYNVGILESHIDWQHSTITAEMKEGSQTENTEIILKKLAIMILEEILCLEAVSFYSTRIRKLKAMENLLLGLHSSEDSEGSKCKKKKSTKRTSEIKHWNLLDLASKANFTNKLKWIVG